MYKKGTALELQFSPRRLVADATDAAALRIELTAADAERLYRVLDAGLAAGRAPDTEPLVVSFADSPTVGAAAAPTVEPDAPAVPPPGDFRQFVCLICGWIYDEALGDVEHGLAPGTRWEQVPDDWRCPLCDVGKQDFALAVF